MWGGGRCCTDLTWQRAVAPQPGGPVPPPLHTRHREHRLEDDAAQRSEPVAPALLGEWGRCQGPMAVSTASLSPSPKSGHTHSCQ